MISLFNRREVRITRSSEEAAQAADKLRLNGIECRICTNSMTNPDRHHGAMGINSDYAYEYRLYVCKKDYLRAKELLGIR